MPSAMAPLETMTTRAAPAARATPSAQLPAPLADGRGVQAAALVGHQAGAHLDDDAARLAQHLCTRFLNHFGRQPASKSASSY
jgi:hypothetical protein